MSKLPDCPTMFGIDTLVDSEDLMSWLLLHPDAEFENQQLQWNDDIPLPTISSPIESKSHDSVSIEQQRGIPLVASSASMSTTAMPSNSSGANSTSKKRPSSTTKSSSSSAVPKKKSKESVEDLEARVNALKAENADLHAHLLNVTQRTTEVQKQRISMEKLMATKLSELGEREDGDQSELAQIVKQYTDIYADYGKCRQREVAFHLQQLEKLIVPTTTTKMCLWTLQQDKNFYQRNKSPMYDILAKELEITAEQTEKIQDRRAKFTGLLHQLRECLQLLKMLKVAIERKHACYDSICGRVQAAATPKQIVQFQMWIGKNAELLAKYVPGFNRTSSYIPSAQFVESENPLSSSIGLKRSAVCSLTPEIPNDDSDDDDSSADSSEA